MSAPGGAQEVRKECTLGVEGRRGGAKYQRLSINRLKNNTGARSDTPWADGPANFFV